MPVVAIFRAGSVEVQLNEKIDSLRRTKHTRGQRENNDKDPAKGIRPWDYSNGTFGIEHLTALGLFFRLYACVFLVRRGVLLSATANLRMCWPNLACLS